MRKKKYGVFILVALCVLFGASCISFHGVSSITYSLYVEEASSTTEGTLALSFFPHEAGKQKVSLTCSLDGEEFSTTLTTSEDNWSSAFLSVLFAQPAFAAFLGPIMASQSMYIVLFAVTKGNLEEGFLWKEKDEEGREVTISVPSKEIRFGREALWIEMQTEGKDTLKMLIEKENLIPFIVDISDKEENKRIYLEAKTVTWKATTSNRENTKDAPSSSSTRQG